MKKALTSGVIALKENGPMENKLRLVLMCLLTSAILIACGPSQAERDAQATKMAADIFATQTAQAPTPTFTSTPTPTRTPTPTTLPTNTPTATPTPLLDLSDVVLTLQDLPPGFEEVPLTELGITEADLSQEGFEIESLSVFLEADNFQLLMGFTMLIPTGLERAAFDLELHHPDFLLEGMMRGMGATDILEQEELPDLDDIAEASAGLTMVADMNGLAMRFDVVVFRRDIVGAFIVLMYPDGDAPLVPLGDVARKLDSHIIEALPPTSVEPTATPTPAPLSATATATPIATGPGGWIAFGSERDGNREIYKMRADGSQVTRLSDNPAKDWGASWSPDGEWIAFVSDRDGSTEIYKMRADGSQVINLTISPTHDTSPSWSPDGEWIAFVSDRDGNVEIYKMGADGSQVTRLSDNPGMDWDVSWSPDGDWIAFVSDRDGNMEIYKMRSDGSQVTRLTDNPWGDWDVSWSPDGEWIAFVSLRNGNMEIYKMRADGRQVINVTNSPASDAGPSWSPDGNWIAFSSDHDDNREIYKMRADGSQVTRLTDNPAVDAGPSWGP